MAMNPADQAFENNKNEIEKLQAEVGIVELLKHFRRNVFITIYFPITRLKQY